MKGEYGVNLVKSEPGSYAGSATQTMGYSEPGSTKKIIVRHYERELSVGGFLRAEITVKTDEAEALLLGSSTGWKSSGARRERQIRGFAPLPTLAR
jgi:hypothetical protein